MLVCVSFNVFWFVFVVCIVVCSVLFVLVLVVYCVSSGRLMFEWWLCRLRWLVVSLFSLLKLLYIDRCVIGVCCRCLSIVFVKLFILISVMLGSW